MKYDYHQIRLYFLDTFNLVAKHVGLSGLSYIILFFFQAGFKYETRNDQIYTQVKLFDKNIVLFFILLW